MGRPRPFVALYFWEPTTRRSMSEQTAPAIEIRAYDRLPEEAVEIRREVFMDEQGHEGELDDVYGRARHIVAFLDGRATATCRLFAGSRKGVPHVWMSKGLGASGDER